MRHLFHISLSIAFCTLFDIASYSQDTIQRYKIDSLPQTKQPHKQEQANRTNFTTSNISWFHRSPTNGSALISAAVVFFFGLLTFWQWRRDQKWKKEDAIAKQTEARWRRKEAVFKRIDTLSATPGTWNALLMLNSSDRDIPLFDKSKIEDRYVRIRRKDVSLALLPPTILEYVKSEKETAIRGCFGDFFSRLSHAEALLSDNEDLVQKKDMHAFIEPIIHIFKCLKESTIPEDQAL